MITHSPSPPLTTPRARCKAAAVRDHVWASRTRSAAASIQLVRDRYPRARSTIGDGPFMKSSRRQGSGLTGPAICTPTIQATERND